MKEYSELTAEDKKKFGLLLKEIYNDVLDCTVSDVDELMLTQSYDALSDILEDNSTDEDEDIGNELDYEDAWRLRNG